ncbi:MAG: response regulator [Pirellulaceae bacterium]|nr:response regulator [Pirellulaceae bacterium]
MSNQTIGRPMEVLLVEDSLTDAALTMSALSKGKFFHRMTLVRDGLEAMEFLHQEKIFARAPRPDVILLDLIMPKKDGLEVLAEVKKDFDLKAIPIVVMTSSEVEEDRLKCELHHVDSYIIKPINLSKFVEVLRQIKRHLLADVILPSAE